MKHSTQCLKEQKVGEPIKGKTGQKLLKINTLIKLLWVKWSNLKKYRQLIIAHNHNQFHQKRSKNLKIINLIYLKNSYQPSTSHNQKLQQDSKWKTLKGMQFQIEWLIYLLIKLLARSKTWKLLRKTFWISIDA